MIKCDIVILDSGTISEDLDKYSNNIVGTLSLTCDKSINDNAGHGTAITNQIINNAPQSTVFLIKILDSDFECDAEVLYKALEYVYNFIDCRIINLSLGVVNPDNLAPLYNVCRKITQRGTVIFSAYDNNGAISYPAAFDCVYGVDSSIDIHNKDEFYYIENSDVNIIAKGLNNRVKWKNGYIFISGTSFSTANISSIVLNELIREKNQTVDNIIKRKATKIIQIPTCSPIKRLPEIHKSLVMPYNKEVHSIVNFHQLFQSKITGFYDVRLSGNVGRRVRSLYDDFETVIQNYTEINWQSNDFDSVVLGHTERLNKLTGFNLYSDVEQKCNLNCKTLISFDRYYSITQNEVVNRNFDKLNIIPHPVLGVFGTSSRQGKFTLQLLIRKKLQEMGYKVGQLGTEPSAELFGFDEVYPMGYNGGVHIDGYQAILYLNQAMNRISNKNPDIIIVGSQSGTVSYWFGNLKQFPVKQIDFLMGTMPDAVLLCVNTVAEINYIRRPINMIESLIETKVLALVLSPLAYAKDWHMLMGKLSPCNKQQLNQIKDDFSENLRLPCFELGNQEDIDKMILIALDYFTR